MPYKCQKAGDKWQNVNSDTGDVKGTFDTEEQAQAQLRALYANAGPDDEAEKDINFAPPNEDAPEPDVVSAPPGEPVAPGLPMAPPNAPLLQKPGMIPSISSPELIAQKADIGGRFEQFIPISKVDTERREVWGWGAVEEPDQANEVLDYNSSKPNFVAWSAQAQKRSGGRSFGNLRAMHQPIAAGKLIAFQPNDQKKGVWVGARIVDEGEWNKVQEGVYTGFSVGGRYLRRWPDSSQPGLVRYTAMPTELSIVDSPCITSSTFDVIKGDHLTKAQFHPGNGANVLILEPDDDDDLEKQGMKAPVSAPEPISTSAFPNKFNETFNVENMARQNRVVDLKDPGRDNGPSDTSIPSQDELAGAAVYSKELQAAFDAWMPKVAAMVKKTVAEALSDYSIQKSTSARMIPVTRSQNLIKVTYKEN